MSYDTFFMSMYILNVVKYIKSKILKLEIITPLTRAYAYASASRGRRRTRARGFRLSPVSASAV